MTATDLFADAETPVASAADLFADVVFDRPLDHAYTYSVPEQLRDAVAVGKRVECPFGKGDTTTPGYVIRVAGDRPVRPVKPLFRVLDDAPLLDDHLLKLTRWMADYYLCGWGQVLHAVVPAGVRDKAGTRPTAFVQVVPKSELPDPLPTVTPKQKQALEALRREDGPVELTAFARRLNLGTGPISGLVGKGLVRKFTERVERSADPLSGSDPAVRLPQAVPQVAPHHPARPRPERHRRPPAGRPRPRSISPATTIRPRASGRRRTLVRSTHRPCPGTSGPASSAGAA